MLSEELLLLLLVNWTLRWCYIYL